MEFSIVGGGLLGRLVAWQLAKAGANVHLYDKGSQHGEDAAAFVAAAMLAPLAEALESTPLVTKLAWQSLALWQEWLPQLPKPVFQQYDGSLLVWHTQDKALSVDFQNQLLRCHGQNNAQWEKLDATPLAALEPQLSGRFSQGLFLKTEGQLDNRQVLTALADALIDVGVDCHWQQSVDDDGITKLSGWVIDCRGMGAKAAWQQNTALASELRGVRGEVARVYAPEVTLHRPIRLLHPRYPLYIAPKENHVFVIGATQLESEDTSQVSVRSGLELLSALYTVHPAFGEARILELASGLRPTLSHHDPEIRCYQSKQLIEVNGLFRHGFMIAPAVCLSVVDLAVNMAKGLISPLGNGLMPCHVQ
jgi:glycine oxidase